jgi:hypothetical protein
MRGFPSGGEDAQIDPKVSRNFLDHYFSRIYNKLEADALLFNRKLPHAGLAGSENEQAIADVLRDFLPIGFGVEVSAIVIDRFGGASRQADIVIYDANQPRFFRKVFPIEIVYAVIQVKTSMGSSDAVLALENLRSVNRLEFRPVLTPYWNTRTHEEGIRHDPPACFVFAYRTDCKSFETFANWFPWSFLQEGTPLRVAAPIRPEIRLLRIVALDKGIIHMESTNGYVERIIASAVDARTDFQTTLSGAPIMVDPSKSLFLFLVRLWFDLETHNIHPGFDIRSYMSPVLDAVVRVDPSIVNVQVKDES